MTINLKKTLVLCLIQSEIFVLHLYTKIKLMSVTALPWTSQKVLPVPVCLDASFQTLWKKTHRCLHVFFVSVSGSGTNKWTGDLYLTLCAKICLPADLFLLSSSFPASPVFSSFMFLFVYIHSGWKSQSEEDAARNNSVLSFSSSFPSPFLCSEMQAVRHAWGFQTSVCAGGPWRVTPP